MNSVEKPLVSNLIVSKIDKEMLKLTNLKHMDPQVYPIPQ